jgi:hypothetical protein
MCASWNVDPCKDRKIIFTTMATRLLGPLEHDTDRADDNGRTCRQINAVLNRLHHQMPMFSGGKPEAAEMALQSSAQSDSLAVFLHGIAFSHAGQRQ